MIKSAMMFLLALFSLSVYSQNLETQLGEIPELDAITSCPNEPDAKAMVLKEEALTNFKYGNYLFWYETTYLVRVKILKEEGLKYASVSIPYSTELAAPTVCLEKGDKTRRFAEEIKDIYGGTYNWNGKKFVATKLKSVDISDQTLSENVHAKQIVFNDVKVGSIIEYRYTKVSYRPEQLEAWSLRREIPVRESRYRIIIPEFFVYDIYQDGNIRISVEEMETSQQFGKMGLTLFSKNGRDIIMTANEVLSNVVEKEPLNIYFTLDYISIPKHFNKSFLTDWTGIDKKLLDTYAGFRKSDSWLPNAKEIGAKEKGKQGLIDLLDELQKQYRFNGQRAYLPSDAQKVKQEKTGNSADLNLMYIGLLQQVGYDASPIVLRTADKGAMNFKRGVADSLNHVLTGIVLDDRFYCVDASSPYTALNVLPIDVLVGQARWLRSDTASLLIDNLASFAGSQMRMINASFGEDGTLQADVKIRYIGESMYDFLSLLQQNDLEQIVRTQCNVAKEMEISELKMSTNRIDERGAFVELSFVLKDRNVLCKEGNTIDGLILPYIVQNPYAGQPARPVEIGYSNDVQWMVNITLPEGYKFKEASSTKGFRDAENTKSARWAVENNEDQLQLSFTIRQMKASIDVSEYDDLVSFYNEILNINKMRFTIEKR